MAFAFLRKKSGKGSHRRMKMIDGRGKQVEKTDSAYTRYRHIVKTGESKLVDHFAFSQSFYMRFADNG